MSSSSIPYSVAPQMLENIHDYLTQAFTYVRHTEENVGHSAPVAHLNTCVLSVTIPGITIGYPVAYIMT